MKKVLHFIFNFSLICFSIGFVVAQDTTSIKVNSNSYYKWGVGVQMYSPEKINPAATERNSISKDGHYYQHGVLKEKNFFSYGFMLHYGINEKYKLRFRAGISNRLITQNYNTSTNIPSNTPFGYYDEGEAIIKQFAQKMGLGFQRTFFVNNFNTYIGLEMQYTNYSSFILNYTTTNFRDTVTYVTNGSYEIPGGFIVGLGPHVGCNYHLTKRISIGAEASFAISYMKLGGNSYNVLNSTLPGVGINGSFLQTQVNQIEKIGFDELTTLVSVFYYFGNKLIVH
jgi:hypothetical protein